MPKPADYKPLGDIKTDPNHGLWDFFLVKDKAVPLPEEMGEHGRSWTVEECRHKSWEDLHKLWWICVKERNMISTANRERKRLKIKTGKDEYEYRMFTVSQSMKAIRHALTERYYNWEDARKLAETDPEIDLANVNQPYTPAGYLEAEEYEQIEGSEEVQYDAEPECAEEQEKETQKLAPTDETNDPSTPPPKTPKTTELPV